MGIVQGLAACKQSKVCWKQEGLVAIDITYNKRLHVLRFGEPSYSRTLPNRNVRMPRLNALETLVVVRGG